MPGSNDPNFEVFNAAMSEAATADTSATDATLKQLQGKIEAHVNKTVGADLRSFTQAEIDNWFTYHSPNVGQIIQYGEIRTAAKIFAETINRHVPAGADKTAAMRKLRDTVMAANLAVACHVVPQRPTIAELEAILQKEDDTPITIKSDGSIKVTE